MGGMGILSKPQPNGLDLVAMDEHLASLSMQTVARALVDGMLADSLKRGQYGASEVRDMLLDLRAVL